MPRATGLVDVAVFVPTLLGVGNVRFVPPTMRHSGRLDVSVTEFARGRFVGDTASSHEEVDAVHDASEGDASAFATQLFGARSSVRDRRRESVAREFSRVGSITAHRRWWIA